MRWSATLTQLMYVLDSTLHGCVVVLDMLTRPAAPGMFGEPETFLRQASSFDTTSPQKVDANRLNILCCSVEQGGPENFLFLMTHLLKSW